MARVSRSLASQFTRARVLVAPQQDEEMPARLKRDGARSPGWVPAATLARGHLQFALSIIPARWSAQLKMIFLRQTKI
jgi:hypothetical protein